MNAPANTTVAPSPAPPIAAKRYYYKELYSNTWYIGGKPVEFEQLDGNRGVLALDASNPLVAGLDAAAQEQVGGIVKISEEEFFSKKNHYPFKSKSQEVLQVAPRVDNQGTKGRAFIPPPPQESPASPAQLVEQKNAGPAGKEDQQKPPDQPDFRTGAGKFSPPTARAGTGKTAEPSPV